MSALEDRISELEAHEELIERILEEQQGSSPDGDDEPRPTAFTTPIEAKPLTEEERELILLNEEFINRGSDDDLLQALETADPEALPDDFIPLPDGQSAVSRPAPKANNVVVVVAAIVSNILVGIVKFIAAAISGSVAMIAEGIHSVVDSGNGALILLGMRRSKRKPDLEHPFGYGSELYFWTLVVAIMIFALGGGFSIFEGVSHLLQVDKIVLGDPTMNYIVIGAAAIIEGTSLVIAIRNFNRARGKTGPLSFIREAKDPSLFTVVLEDSAAELGLIFAFCGVFFSHLLGNPAIDAAASIFIGLLLCCVSVLLLRETKGLLIGEGLKTAELERVEAIVEANEYVVECGRILSLYLGPHDLLLAIDATFERTASRDDIVFAIDAIESTLVAQFPDVTRIFIESESLRYTHEQAVAMDAEIEAAEAEED